jgi:hypothetical protein
MNIPTNILKSNYLPPDRVKYHQKLAKRYSKQISKVESNFPKSKPNQMANLKEDILNWFFSLDVITKLIISSIENKWLTNILHQLYLQYKNNPRLRFQLHEETLSEMLPQLIPHGYQIITPCNNAELCFINYFYTKEDYRVNEEKSINEGCFLQQDIKFYRTEEFSLSDPMSPYHKYSNYFSLGNLILQESEYFKKIFDTLSGGQAFTNPIPCEYNPKTKLYSFGYPTWMSGREYFSVAEYFIAFFEQVITIRYFTCEKGGYTVDNSIYLNKLLSEKRALSSFIRKEFSMNAHKLCDAIEISNLIEEVKDDYRIKEIINAKAKGLEMITLGILYNSIEVYDYDISPTSALVKNIKHYFSCFKNAEELIDCLMFTNLENIFTYDDFLMKRFYESLVDLMAKKSAFDLMNGYYEKNEMKKKTKKKKKKKIDIEMGISCFSFIKKMKTGQFKPGEFMGDFMMVKRTENTDEIRTMVKEVVDKVLENVCQQVEAIQSESSEDTANADIKKSYDDKDTAYSSANQSDNGLEVYPKKRKKQNKYKLYDFKVKEEKKVKDVDIKHHSLKDIDTPLSDIYTKERSTSLKSTNCISLNVKNNTPTKSSNAIPMKANTTSSFQLNIKPQELDVQQPKYERFSPHNPSNDYYMKHNYQNGFRFYYEMPINNCYYFNEYNSLNELFNFRFQKYIITYTETVDSNLNSLKDTKDRIIDELIVLIKDLLCKILLMIGNFNVSSEIYGSYASGLAIESSDVDISIKHPDNFDKDIYIMITKVTDCLKLTGKVEEVYPIYTANVPLIKLVTNSVKLDYQPKCILQTTYKRHSRLFIQKRGHRKSQDRLNLLPRI